MKTLLIATHNKGKFTEIKEVLGDLPCKIVSLDDVNISEDVEETGTTFEENAEIKARFFAQKSQLPTVADDSGIIVDALKGELGVKTRRWGAGASATDEEWMNVFMSRMHEESNKNASFMCAVCFCHDGQVQHFLGKTDGKITETMQADYLPGLPLSAVFVPDGFDQVYSNLSIEQKNKVSHRGKAFHALKEYLDNNHL